MKTILVFTGGLAMGIVVAFLIWLYLYSQSFKYVELTHDYKIETVGTLKKGTLLRIDEGMSEGFTRFILYLNLRDDSPVLKPEHDGVIIPYWLKAADTTEYK